jgi:hypothetical protein
MQLSDIEANIYQNGSLNREDILNFLSILPTSDQQAVTTAVNEWLLKLHADQHFSKVMFDDASVQRILDDLGSYGRVQHETIIDAPPAPQVQLGPEDVDNHNVGQLLATQAEQDKADL